MDFAGSRARLTALSAGLLMAAAASARSVDTPLGRAGPPQVQSRSGPGSVRETGLFLRPDALRSLRDARAGEEIVVRGFPLDDTVAPDLELQRFELYAPSAEIVEAGPGGAEARVPVPEGVFFEGRVAGDPESRVFLSAFGASLHGYVQRGDETFAIAPRGGWDRETPEHFARKLTREEWAALAASWRCDAELRPPSPSREALLSTAVADTGQPYSATIAVDTDYELYHSSFSGNATAERNYVSNELAAVSAIYWRDLKTRLQVGFLRVWTAQADPWSATTPLASLFEVGDYWHAHGGATRSAVVFLSGKNTGGGVSWIGTLCEGDFWDSGDGHWGGAYAVVGNVSGKLTNFQHPAAGSDVWDIEAVAHELGHTFGSVHTHCYAPPIDECYGSELGCYSGPAVDPGPGVGTIMSYCHFFGWSEISLKFHSRCITEQMRPTILGAASAAPACLTGAGFLDVSPNDIAAPAIATIAAWGITVGCGPQTFCPTATVTRAQMAVFIERGLGVYVPPPGRPQIFDDVAPGSFGYDFIGDFARRGITSGCTPSAYCPSDGVTRAQMAVFLLRAEHGSAYSPPPATGTMFSDVPASSFTSPWIEQLAREAITAGCGNGKFCPGQDVPRGQMAIFLVRTFHL